MKTVYGLTQGYFDGRVLDLTDDGDPPIPVGYVPEQPPVLQAGEYAQYAGGHWTVTSTPPDPVAPDDFTVPTYGSKITTDALYRRLTAAERRRIELASIDPGVDGPARNLAADLRVEQRRLSGASYFDLAMEENITTFHNLEAAALLDPPQHGGATRAAEIMAAPVTDPTELPGSIRLLYNLPEVPQ